MELRVAIVGCGLIGQRRAASLGLHRLMAVADTNLDRARTVATVSGGSVKCVTDDWRQVVAREDVDAVVASTTNDMLAVITRAAIDNGKHVLVEKPAGRRSAEIEPLINLAKRAGVVVKVGFNHRFHPALAKAKEIWDSGACGEFMFIRGRYGHGGRLGMEREWRGNPQVAGGGEMLDQGVHLIDLSRWFAGDFTRVTGRVATYFWDWPMEDNGFAMLENSAGRVAWLHASCTEWKNLFSFEIYGKIGKLHIEGLGGSYGVERLSFYKMLPRMGPPETMIWEYPGVDTSWLEEFSHFARCIQNQTPVSGSLDDALACLDTVESLYQQSAACTPIPGTTR